MIELDEFRRKNGVMNIRANPLEDVTNTRAIAGVIADGKYWSSADLDALGERLKQVAARR